MKARAAAWVALAALNALAFADDAVVLRRVPDGGMKPSAAVDETGVLHLVYFRGEPTGGDAFYTTSRDGGATFSPSQRVNSQPGSVLGVSSIRGPKLALGHSGSMHVAWNGSSTATPKGPLNPAMAADSPFNGTPLLYTRLASDGKSFEPQRNLLQQTCALDGGSDLAADREGRVFVVFHAQLPGAKSEAGRAVFVAASTDDGATFSSEKNVLPEPTGVCACCAIAAHTDTVGALAILYRGATESIHRGMHLLISHDHGGTFTHITLDDWKLAACPMSSAALTTDGSEFLGLWENAGRIRIGDFTGGGLPVSDTGDGQKYPAIARNKATRERVIAWTEGMGWNRGGLLVWQHFNGFDITTDGRKDGVPANGNLAAIAMPDGKFVILY